MQDLAEMTKLPKINFSDFSNSSHLESLNVRTRMISVNYEDSRTIHEGRPELKFLVCSYKDIFAKYKFDVGKVRMEAQ